MTWCLPVGDCFIAFEVADRRLWSADQDGQQIGDLI
jgi:hypothetical protein